MDALGEATGAGARAASRAEPFVQLADCAAELRPYLGVEADGALNVIVEPSR